MAEPMHYMGSHTVSPSWAHAENPQRFAKDKTKKNKIHTMKTSIKKVIEHAYEQAKIGYAMLWLLGVPLPILLIIYLVRGH
jgi:hypothetical protein